LFALRYPERTRSLVLVSAVSHAILARPSVMDRVYHSIVNDFIYWSFVHLSKPALLAALGVPFAEQKTLSKQDVSQAYAFLDSMMPMAARRDGLIFDLTRMAQYNADQIQNIQAPTLVIHALNDTLVPFEQAQFAASRIPGAKLVTLEKGGHFAILFSPQARAKIVEFLEQTNL
jgi:pimeloyl-ACP methyl ester carboxylesterase